MAANEGISIEGQGQVDGMILMGEDQLVNIMKIRLENSFCGPVIDKQG